MSSWGEIREALNTRPKKRQAASASGFWEGAKNLLSRQDPSVSRAGIPSASLRYGLSRQDTKEERERYLDRQVGAGNWGRDRRGRYTLMPQAASRFGVQSDIPVLIDEPGLTRYDISDVGGDLPAVGGAITGAALGAPGGLPGLIGGAALGAAGAKGYQESAEALAGENIQGPSEVAADLGKEAALAAAGEAVFAPLAVAGRFALAPEAKRMTPAIREAIRESKEIGVVPRPSAMTGAPLIGRFESLADKVLGDPLLAKNNAALERELDRMRSALPSTSRTSAGEVLKASVSTARSRLNDWAEVAYGKVNTLMGGQPVVDTSGVKAIAEEIQQAFTEGMTPSGQVIEYLRKFPDGPDRITVQQAQVLRSEFRALRSDNTLVPGMKSNFARRLEEALTEAMEGIPGEAGQLLKEVNAAYGKQISKFDDVLIEQLARNPKRGGWEPERVADLLFRPHNAGAINRAMAFLDGPDKLAVRRAVLENILEQSSRFEQGQIGAVWNPVGLQNALKRYGGETLDAALGKTLAKDLQRFSRVLHASTMRTKAMSGGIVAANIALHPIKNLGRLVRLKVLSDFLVRPNGFKWATEGLEAPNTRKGAAALSRFAIQLQLLANSHTRERQTDGRL